MAAGNIHDAQGWEKKAQVDGRAAGMQPMLIHWIFLKDVRLGQWWTINMLHKVKCWVRKSLWDHRGLWVKAQKWRAAKLRKRRGEGAENAELKERKGLLIQKNEKKLTRSPSFTISRSLPKLMSIESVMPSNHLILCRPLLLLPSIFPLMAKSKELKNLLMKVKEESEKVGLKLNI